MNIRMTLVAGIAAVCMVPAAASAFERDEHPVIEKGWGASFEAAKKAQIANPDAGAVTGPVAGFDGMGAKKAMDAYHESFSQQNTRQGYSLDSISVISGGASMR